MSVRRGATWLGTVGLLVGTMVPLAAAPAVAEGESVRVRAPKSISAGGSPGAVTVTVSMRSGDCVNVRTVLGVHLPGLAADRVEVQVAADGGWRRVSVAEAGDGLIVTRRTAPNKPELCAKKSVNSRYRVELAKGAPGGRVTLLAEAYTAGGRLLGRGTDSARVTGRTGDTPSSPARTSEPTIPSATEEATEAAAPETTEEVAAAVPTVRAAEESGGSLGLGGLVIGIGMVMVGIGIALIVLLIRRSRAERRRLAGTPSTDADPTARIVLLGAEQTTRIAAPGAEQTTRMAAPGADPTARIAPAGPVFRSASRTPGAGPVGPAGSLHGAGPVGPAGSLHGAGSVGPAGPGAGGAGGVPPVVGDQTLILPAAGTARPRPGGATPPRPPGTVPPHPTPPYRDGPVDAEQMPARPAPPRPGGAVPPEPPSAGSPDATMILPPSRRPPEQ